MFGNRAVRGLTTKSVPAVVLEAEAAVLGNPKQQRFLAIEENGNPDTVHYQELFGNEVGFQQVSLAQTLTNVSNSSFEDCLGFLIVWV